MFESERESIQLQLSSEQNDLMGRYKQREVSLHGNCEYNALFHIIHFSQVCVLYIILMSIHTINKFVNQTFPGEVERILYKSEKIMYLQ